MPEKRGLPGLREHSEPPETKVPSHRPGPSPAPPSLAASVHTWGLELGLSGADPRARWLSSAARPGGHYVPHLGGVTHTREPRPSPDGTRGPRGGVPAAFLTTSPRPRTEPTPTNAHTYAHKLTYVHTHRPWGTPPSSCHCDHKGCKHVCKDPESGKTALSFHRVGGVTWPRSQSR